LGIKTKSHKSVQIAIDTVVNDGHLTHDMGIVLNLLLARRNEAVYRYARRDWTEEHAADSMRQAEAFIGAVQDLIST